MNATDLQPIKICDLIVYNNGGYLTLMNMVSPHYYKISGMISYRYIMWSVYDVYNAPILV